MPSLRQPAVAAALCTLLAACTTPSDRTFPGGYATERAIRDHHEILAVERNNTCSNTRIAYFLSVDIVEQTEGGFVADTRYRYEKRRGRGPSSQTPCQGFAERTFTVSTENGVEVVSMSGPQRTQPRRRFDANAPDGARVTIGGY